MNIVVSRVLAGFHFDADINLKGFWLAKMIKILALLKWKDDIVFKAICFSSNNNLYSVSEQRKFVAQLTKAFFFISLSSENFKNNLLKHKEEIRHFWNEVRLTDLNTFVY